MPKQRRRPGARNGERGPALALHRVLARTDDGAPVTVAETILDWLARGHPRNVALAHANVSGASFNEWLRAAARASAKVANDPDARLTKNERTLMDFGRRVDEASAIGEGLYWSSMSDLAKGGLSKNTVIIKTYRDGTTEQIQRAERMAPSFQAAKFMLETSYGRAIPLDVRIEGALTDDEALAHFADAMERWLSTNTDEPAPTPLAIEVNGHETNGHTNGQTPPH